MPIPAVLLGDPTSGRHFYLTPPEQCNQNSSTSQVRNQLSTSSTSAQVPSVSRRASRTAPAVSRARQAGGTPVVLQRLTRSAAVSVSAKPPNGSRGLMSEADLLRQLYEVVATEAESGHALRPTAVIAY